MFNDLVTNLIYANAVLVLVCLGWFIYNGGD